jgi:hypothetical protein
VVVAMGDGRRSFVRNTDVRKMREFCVGYVSKIGLRPKKDLEKVLPSLRSRSICPRLKGSESLVPLADRRHPCLLSLFCPSAACRSLAPLPGREIVRFWFP